MLTASFGFREEGLAVGTRTHNSIQVTERAFTALEKLAADTELNKKVITERLFVWLQNQEEDVRSVVLRMVPASLTIDVARLILRRLNQAGPVSALALGREVDKAARGASAAHAGSPQPQLPKAG